MDVGREALLPERARGEDRSRVELEELRPDHRSPSWSGVRQRVGGTADLMFSSLRCRESGC